MTCPDQKYDKRLVGPLHHRRKRALPRTRFRGRTEGTLSSLSWVIPCLCVLCIGLWPCLYVTYLSLHTSITTMTPNRPSSRPPPSPLPASPLPYPPTALCSFSFFVGFCLFFRTWGFSCFFTFWTASLDFYCYSSSTHPPPHSHLAAPLFHPITKPRSFFVPQPSNQCVYRMKNNHATKHMHAVHSWRPLSSEGRQRKQEVMTGLGQNRC